MDGGEGSNGHIGDDLWWSESDGSGNLLDASFDSTEYSAFLHSLQTAQLSPPSTPAAFMDAPAFTLNPLEVPTEPLSLSELSDFFPAAVPPSPQVNYSQERICVSVQPERYQVVNYNVHPPPELQFFEPFSEAVTVEAFLCYEANTLDILEGFTTGDVQVLRAQETRLCFSALHLNRMTPIKTAVQQHGSSLGGPFTIKWKIGELCVFSSPFKLVSAVNQIPEGMEVRPRQKVKEKSGAREIKSVKSGGGKRRAVDGPQHEDESFIQVKVRGEAAHRGFINLPKNASLTTARSEIVKSSHYPISFRFWHDRMKTIVQLHQEDSIHADDTLDGTCLILDEYDASMDSVDHQILALWLSQKNSKNPTISLTQLMHTLFSVYQAGNSQPAELNIIDEGIRHFFVNIIKSNAQEGVTMEDFRLFLKFYGPANQCLSKVYNVYSEPFFHGFARHSDAVELLKGHPGAYLARYSESQLKDGFFAFNLNKGNETRDQVENYSMRYHADQGCFIFRNKRYSSLGDFVRDPNYQTILRFPLRKSTVEIIKESKYQNDTNFLAFPVGRSSPKK